MSEPSVHAGKFAPADPRAASASATEREAGVQKPRGGRRVLLLLVGLVVVWTLLMRQFGGADVYAVLGPYAMIVILMLWLLRGSKLHAWFAPSPRAIAI